MLWNVLASWAGQLVFLLAGFFMPRMIDTHVGQAALGIWDFSWSLVSYFGLANLGVGSSVNRYVAMYRAANDITSLKTAVSSVLAFQVVAGTIVAGQPPSWCAACHFFSEKNWELRPNRPDMWWLFLEPV